MAKTVEQVLEQFNVIEQQREEFEKQKKVLMESFKQSMEQLCKDLFEVVPSIKCISWTQYTPYFADGDECIFSLNTFNFYNFVPEDLGYDAEDVEYEEDQWGFSMATYYDNKYSKKKTKVTQEDFNVLKKFFDIMNANEDFLKEVIGDHVQVILTSEEMKVEEYEHD